jgi:phospholipid/cholesterol/gamma-HCH transport system substrate-binding protein
VELLVQLPGSVHVRADDVVSISTFGLLGEKYLEISPGLGEGAPLQSGDMLVGKPPVSTEDIIERSNEVLNELKQTLGGINSLVGDPEARLYLKETSQEARDAIRYWKLLGARLNVAMSRAESGEGNLGKFLYDEALYREMEAFVQDIKQNPWKLLARPRKQQ